MSHAPGHKMNMGSKEKDSPGSFSEKDTKTIGKSTQSKLVSYSSKTTNQPIKKGYSTAGTKTVRKSTYSTGSAGVKNSGGSSEFKKAYSSAKSSGASDFKFKGKSYTTKSASSPKKRTQTLTSVTEGIKTPNTPIKAPTLNKKVPITKKTIIPPPTPQKRKRKKFKYTGVGKFVRKTGRAIGDIQINLPSIRLPKFSKGRKKQGGGQCWGCKNKLRRTMRR